MGPIGTGKSTFIKCATGEKDRTVGHGLRPGTTDIRTVKILHPPHGSVIFVDTPGFNGPSQSDVEILSMIADYLVQIYKEKANLAVIVYLHKIDDNRMNGSILKNLQTFARLCGTKAMPNVVIATTMWSNVDADEGIKREDELQREFWAEMKAGGCRTERFEKTEESAWRVIGSLGEKDQAQVQLTSEMVDDGLPLEKTEAGIMVNQLVSQDEELKAFTKKLRGLFSQYIRM